MDINFGLGDIVASIAAFLGVGAYTDLKVRSGRNQEGLSVLSTKVAEEYVAKDDFRIVQEDIKKILLLLGDKE